MMAKSFIRNETAHFVWGAETRIEFTDKLAPPLIREGTDALAVRHHRWCGPFLQSRRNCPTHSNMERKDMRKQIMTAAVFILVHAAAASAADDPFTGTWQETILLILAPVSGGISIQDGTQKPEIVLYGQDTPRTNGFTTNTVRIDDRTLQSTISRNGEVSFNETATSSADGKHFARVEEFLDSSKLTYEYDRIGPVPSGDLFFGSWKQILVNIGARTISRARTVKVDGDSFEWTGPGPLKPGLTGKFDGREYQGRGFFGIFTYVLKRTDDHTIEMVRKEAHPENRPDWAAEISAETEPSVSKVSESREIWRVKGDILTITSQDQDGTQSEPTVQEFERVK